MPIGNVFELAYFQEATHNPMANPRRLYDTYEKLKKLLDRHNIKFVLVGGFAMARYMPARHTTDIDISVVFALEADVKDILDSHGFEYMDKGELTGFEGAYSSTFLYNGVPVDVITSKSKFFSKMLKDAVYYDQYKAYVATAEAMIPLKKIASLARSMGSDIGQVWKGEQDEMDYRHMLRTKQYDPVKLKSYADLTLVGNMIAEDILKLEKYGS